MNASSSAALLGVFDSGVGGLSVLRALHQRLPTASLLYVADSAYAPYGERSVAELIERSRRLTKHLLDQGARMVVVACNTATTAAIRELRTDWPHIPFVGVEPGVKPAVALSRNGRIGVLATRRTIASERMRSLVEQHAPDREVILQPCPGLADAIESGKLDGPAMHELLRGFCEPLRAARVDTVVLGCTHYPFVAEHIRVLMGPDVVLIDTADAVAQRAQALWVPPSHATETPTLRLETTGDPVLLAALAQRWLAIETTARRVGV